MKKLIFLAIATALLFTGCTVNSRQIPASCSYITEEASMALNMPNAHSSIAELCSHCTHKNKKTYAQQKATSSHKNYSIDDMMDSLNVARDAANLPVLTFDDDLTKAAFIRAEECSVLFEHTRPNGESCTTVCDKVNGKILLKVSTIRSYGYSVQLWLDSPAHREVLLRDCTMNAGIGFFVNAETGLVYWCVLFDQV